MAEVIWTKPALQSLNDIAEYIALSNVQAAKALIAKVFDSVERLELFPFSGRLIEELPEFDYREVLVKPCRIFYKVEGETVFVLNVLRQERSLRKFLVSQNS